MFRAGLRLLEQQQEEYNLKLIRLRQEAELGFSELDNGKKITVTDNELEDYIGSLGKKASAKVKQS